VTRCQLLIRSQKEKPNEQNIDLIFTDVEYMEVPSLMEKPEIDLAPPGSLADLKDMKMLRIKDEKVYRLQTEGKSFLIAAGNFCVDENDLDRMETSLILPGSGLRLAETSAGPSHKAGEA
jgi:hypothetical protein